MSERFIDFASSPDAIGRLRMLVARTKIYSGEPIIEEKFTQKGAGPLAMQLSSGKRAIAVKINAENTAGGFIRPGDRVDVLHTSSQAADGRVVTQVLLEGITVLAIDQASDSEIDKPRNTYVGRTATLELSAQQAEVIVAAETQGRISLALRSAHEELREDEERASSFRTMRTIRGAQSEVERVSQSSVQP
jgi:pilus assembly protein CpaB